MAGITQGAHSPHVSNTAMGARLGLLSTFRKEAQNTELSTPRRQTWQEEAAGPTPRSVQLPSPGLQPWDLHWPHPCDQWSQCCGRSCLSPPAETSGVSEAWEEGRSQNRNQVPAPRPCSQSCLISYDESTEHEFSLFPLATRRLRVNLETQPDLALRRLTLALLSHPLVHSLCVTP